MFSKNGRFGRALKRLPWVASFSGDDYKAKITYDGFDVAVLPQIRNVEGLEQIRSTQQFEGHIFIIIVLIHLGTKMLKYIQCPHPLCLPTFPIVNLNPMVLSFERLQGTSDHFTSMFGRRKVFVRLIIIIHR